MLSSSNAQIKEAQVLKMSAARDLVLMLYACNEIGQQKEVFAVALEAWPTVHFFGQSFSLGCHLLIYQLPKGGYLSSLPSD